VTGTAPRLFQAARACYGATLLVAPGTVIRAVTRRPAGSRTCAVVRLLGARHVLQAAATTAAGAGTGPLGLGAAIDLTHAASMAGLALADRQVRRLALTDAAIETSFAAAGLSAAWPGLARSGSG
jgi:hypothetical protein